MPPLVDEWTSGGLPVRLVTAALPGERPEDHQERHDEAVTFWKGAFPPD